MSESLKSMSLERKSYEIVRLFRDDGYTIPTLASMFGVSEEWVTEITMRDPRDLFQHIVQALGYIPLDAPKYMLPEVGD